MKEYIKLFNDLQSADGYVINDIPFTCTAISGDGTGNINLRCNEEDKKLEVEGGQIEVVNNITILSLTIGEYTIQYEQGMTWERWLRSEYNSLNWMNEIDFGVMTYAGEVVKSNNSFISVSSLINNSTNYTISKSLYTGFFTIPFDEGMTWYSWENSLYNRWGIVVSDYEVLLPHEGPDGSYLYNNTLDRIENGNNEMNSMCEYTWVAW